MSYQIPAGCWAFDGNTLKRSHFINADLFSTGASFGKAHEAYGEIGFNNIADLYDGPNGGENLSRRKITWTLDNMNARMAAQNSAYSDNYLIYGTGLASAGTAGSGTGGTISGSGVTPGANGIPGVGVVPGFTFNPNGINPYSPNGSGAYAPMPGGNGDITAPDSENTGAILNLRLSLIEKYCDKYGKTVDVDKIRSEYGSDPEKGVEYCDDILNNKFDQAKLAKLVKKEYDAYNKSRLDAGKQVSDQWVDAIIKGGLPSPTVNGGVNKNNVLDVVGTFTTNKEVKRGKVSLDNVMEQPEVTSQLIEALKAKADEVLQYDDLDERTRDRITDEIAGLRDNYDMYTDSLEDEDKHNDLGFNKVRKPLANRYMNLFGILRTEQARRNDAAAPQYYGLPENSSIKFSSQLDRANEEIGSYMGRRKLSTMF